MATSPAKHNDLSHLYQPFKMLPPDVWTGNKERIVYAIPETGFAELDLFELLPTRPYCTNDLAAGLRIRNKRHALKHKHISVNNPWTIKVLLFDVDQGDLSAAQWLPLDLPPTWICSNPISGNAHIAYVLNYPVDKQNPKSIKYLRAVTTAIRYVLDADPGYVGLITHNPTRSDHWAVQWSGETYKLADLAYPAFQQCPPSILDRNTATANVADTLAETVAPSLQGKGNRNNTLFECVRSWSYEAVRAFRGRDYSDFYRETMAIAEQMASCIPQPLSASDVRSMARSVSWWTWQRDPEALAKYRGRQAWKGRGGKDPEQARQRKAENAGRPTRTEPWPWEALGLSRAAYYRRGLHRSE